MGEPESALFEQAASGDAAALRTLLERHWATVWSEIAGQIGRTWQALIDADDVMQVTYIEAFLQIGALQARDAAGFLGWLRRIAQNNLRDAIKELERKKRPSPARQLHAAADDDSAAALIELLGAESATPSRQVAAGEARGMLREALDCLPPDYAKGVRLYDLENRDIGEVASALGRSPGAVHMLRARAHDHLRELLGTPTRFFSGA